MFSMSSQNTFGKVRLNDKVESRVRGDLYARFGGECLETYHCNKWKGAGCLAYGQIASAKIPLSRMISPALYWVMTGDDFSLDINNPKEPKILVVGNNPDRQNIYSAALGLYNSRIVKLINKKGQLKSSVIIDELPTIYFRGLDNLIATARSNKVAVLLGFQDYSQLTRDYGDKESRVIQNTVGNVFSGQVVGETETRVQSVAHVCAVIPNWKITFPRSWTLGKVRQLNSCRGRLPVQKSRFQG